MFYFHVGLPAQATCRHVVELDSMAGGKGRGRGSGRGRGKRGDGGWGPPIYGHGARPQVQGKTSED